jgi:hypothetical protein
MNAANKVNILISYKSEGVAIAVSWGKAMHVLKHNQSKLRMSLEIVIEGT